MNVRIVAVFVLGIELSIHSMARGALAIGRSPVNEATSTLSQKEERTPLVLSQDYPENENENEVSDDEKYSDPVEYSGELNSRPPLKLDPEEIRRKYRRNQRYQTAKTLVQSGLISAAGALSVWAMADHPAPLLIMSHAFSDLFISNSRTFWGKIKPSYLQNPDLAERSKRAEDLHIQYELVQEKLSPEARSKIKRYLDQLQYVVHGGTPPRGSNLRGVSYEEVVYYLDMAFSLPQEKKRLTRDKEAIRRGLGKYMETFDEGLNDTITEHVWRIIESSEQLEASQIGKFSLYFLGSPGTGKTSTAKEIAAQLGIPFCPIRLSKLSTLDLTGNAAQKRPSVITECLVNSKKDGKNYKNLVIFFDDVSHVVNNHRDAGSFRIILNELLENESKTFNDEYLGFDVDISDVIFIFSGNHEIDDGMDDGALNSRLIEVKFPKVPLKMKLIIAEREMIRISSKYKLKPTDVDYRTVTAIAEFDDKLNDGVRILKKVIESYIVRRVSQAAGWVKNPKPFDIEKAFRKQTGRVIVR